MPKKNTHIEKMRLTNETDIMGLLFYLIEENKNIQFDFFNLIHGNQINKKTSIKITPESVQGNRSRPDVEYTAKKAKTQSKRLDGCIEAKLTAAVSTDQIQKYSKFKHITLLIPEHKIEKQKTILQKMNKDTIYCTITWTQVHDLLIKNNKENDVQKAISHILSEHIKDRLKENRFIFDVWKKHPRHFTDQNPTFDGFLQNLADQFNCEINERIDGSAEKWRGVYLKSKNFWIGFVNDKFLSKKSNSVKILFFTKNKKDLYTVNSKLNFWTIEDHDIEKLPASSWKSEKWKSAFHLTPKPISEAKEEDVVNELYKIIGEFL